MKCQTEGFGNFWGKKIVLDLVAMVCESERWKLNVTVQSQLHLLHARSLCEKIQPAVIACCLGLWDRKAYPFTWIHQVVSAQIPQP